jgi:hypothetical protein
MVFLKYQPWQRGEFYLATLPRDAVPVMPLGVPVDPSRAPPRTILEKFQPGDANPLPEATLQYLPASVRPHLSWLQRPKIADILTLSEAD